MLPIIFTISRDIPSIGVLKTGEREAPSDRAGRTARRTLAKASERING